MNFSRLILLIAIVAVISSCGPLVTIDRLFEERAPRRVAFLPVEIKQVIEPRKVQEVKDAIQVELEARGFYVLADDAAEAICSSPACPERDRLFEQFDIDATVSLILSEISESSFGIGYTNTIDGELAFHDRAGNLLLYINHDESERGGIIFDSGQIVRGLREQFSSDGETFFKALARDFAREVVAGIPASMTPGAAGIEDDVVIESTTIDAFASGFSKVCIKGTPARQGRIHFGRTTSSLREVSPGSYCTIVNLPSEQVSITASLRSAWGGAATMPVKVPVLARCDITSRLKLKNSQPGKPVSIDLQCARLGNARQTKGCEEVVECKDFSLEIFRTYSTPSPFVKLKRASANRWIDGPPQENTRYYGLLVDSNGIAMPAISIIPEKEEN